MMSYFEVLGDRVLSAFAASHFDGTQLPSIAREALESLYAAHRVSWLDIAQWVSTANHLPPQPGIDHDFGEPPVTVYWHPTFHIDVIFWHTAPTSIHQHSFSGAFLVLSGSSIQTEFDFNIEHRVNSHLLLGSLRLTKATLLSAGHVQSIVAGSRFIHATFHIGLPTVTVVIRTTTDLETLPQYDYHPPTLALDSRWSYPIGRRRSQLAHLISTVTPDMYPRFLETTLAHSDAVTCYDLLRDARAVLGDSPDYYRLVSLARGRHGHAVDYLIKAIHERLRRGVLMRLRQVAQTPEESILLALMVTLPGLDSIVNVLSQCYPGLEPLTLLSRWVLEFCTRHPDLVPCTNEFVSRLPRLLDTLIEVTREPITASLSSRFTDEDHAVIAECENSVLRPLVADNASAALLQ